MTLAVKRCEWIQGKPDYYLAYHDTVWGKPCYNDQGLFRWLILETFHVGLSWQLVLSKQAAFDRAFDGFEIERVARYDADKIQALTQDAGIIRHRGKIQAAVTNARAVQTLQAEWGSFADYLWHFTQGRVIMRLSGQAMKTSSDLSDQVSQDMKQRGFKFIGSVTIYSYLQAIGIINDHDADCAFR